MPPPVTSPRRSRAALLVSMAALLGGCVRAGFDLLADATGDAGDAGGERIGDGGNDLHGDGADGPIPGGTHLWSRRLGRAGAIERIWLAADGSGNIHASGRFLGTINLGGADLTSAGKTDVFLASYSALGAHRWSARFGDSAEQQALGLAVDASGNIAVVGSFERTIDLGGDALTSAGDEDAFVAAFTQNGAHAWSRRAGGSGADAAHAVTFDVVGNVHVAGSFTGSAGFGGSVHTSAGETDIFIAAYDEGSGGYLWSRAYGGSELDEPRGIAAAPPNRIVVAGSYRGTADLGGADLTSVGETDAFVACYEGDTHAWSLGLGGVHHDHGAAIAADASGDVFVVGTYEATIDLAGGSLSSAGLSDAFVASYATPADTAGLAASATWIPTRA